MTTKTDDIISELENDAKKDKGYYESLGMCRYTLILGKTHKEKLTAIAKQFRITQGSVIEAFLDNVDIEKMSPIFAAKETKGGGRIANQTVKQRDLMDMLKGMTPAQLEAAQQALAAVKTPKV